MKSWQVRGALNWANTSTPLGLIIARAGNATVDKGPRDLHLAGGYRWAFPMARAFTIGSVIISAQSLPWLRSQEALLAHEERHSTQWAALGGLPFLPLYLAATAYSQWRVGDRGAANVFERLADPADGGYQLPTLEDIVRLRERRRVHRAALVSRALGRRAAVSRHC